MSPTNGQFEGKDFWESNPDFDALVERTRNPDSLERWAAIFELGERGDARAADRLRLLTSDSDEFVRDAARSALAKINVEVLRESGTLEADGSTCVTRARRMRTHLDAPVYTAWKTRPVPTPSRGGTWVIHTVVQEIVEVEGPVTGGRVLSLYCRAVSPNTMSQVPHAPIRSAIERLVKKGKLVRCDDFSSDKVEEWTLQRVGSPCACVRQRGLRELKEIPATEVREALLSMAGPAARRRGLDHERAFELIVSFYAAEKELEKIGLLLTNQWRGLLNA
ncbi:MAG: HEAT repeat domain-containing protein [Coriobacteriia bacterium]|nr:HEAT repeat domain-containing protein [Coriobacteriia bacterium]